MIGGLKLLLRIRVSVALGSDTSLLSWLALNEWMKEKARE